MGKLLSLMDAAERTAMSVAFWRKATAAGRIPIVRVGRLVRVREEDVDAVTRLGVPRTQRDQR